MSYVLIRSCIRKLRMQFRREFQLTEEFGKFSGSLDVEETARGRRLDLSTYQLRVNSVARVTWLDKQLSAATLETAVMVIAIHYSYHQLC